MVEKIVFQRLGKKQIAQERRIDTEANRKTLIFLRKKLMANLDDVKQEFGITTNCARNRLDRLKNSGYLSARKNKGKKIYFPTKQGFEKLPREKGQKPQIITEIKEIEIEKVKLDKVKYLGEIG